MNGAFLTGFDDFAFGMVNSSWLQRKRPPKNDHLISYFKVLLHEREVPPAAMQTGSPIIQDNLKNRFLALTKPLHTHGNDTAARDSGLAQFQIAYRPELTAIFVAAGLVQQ